MSCFSLHGESWTLITPSLDGDEASMNAVQSHQMHKQALDTASMQSGLFDGKLER
jgi:hypothetical protein